MNKLEQNQTKEYNVLFDISNVQQNGHMMDRTLIFRFAAARSLGETSISTSGCLNFAA